ncbi:DNA replication/repair protein RecF [Azospirillum humicireducens]|uniref:DNA replication and repair protein RecF n=1 Tax=Azospirillum humicireducens TaxID=1226968 RepID=A0A160JIM6_9PROT|nr:DNA replication/repair protein RecF [Azospirillum humicireducens]ANC92973.1 DNA replication/repair protein RecF [Azospirillum humicireducens]
MSGGTPVAAAPLTPALAVRRMTLTRFRGYESARLEPDRRPVALIGPNGAGKTNLLEAVSFLAPGRGIRGARLAEVERLGSPPGAGWAVAAMLDTPLGPVEIGTGREPHDGNRQGGGRTSERDRRLVRIDGHPAKGQTALADHVAMVWLTPQMDRLFLEGSSGRRRFLDRLVFGFDPAHAGRLSRYEHALRERARLLRDGRFDEGWLGALEDQMATTGIAVAAARREVVQRLRAACARSVGPFPGADLTVAGTVERWLDEGPALAAEDALRDSLRIGRRTDADAGGATVGPHKSDLAVRHAAKDMPAALCSTGEQKALLIAIVLANARLLAAERGAAPILLLDEVAAHLDPGRRAALFGEILALGAQAWMTGTDEGVFDPLGDDARRFRIEDAHIRPG